MVNLNFARKWRSRTFDEMVGQALSVRILKNTLYLDHFFPVYLFSGQRGCGKTTTARIFAGAINCEKLIQFQENPKGHTVPCLECRSCLAMKANNHPDFIEMDAASHTGVDNVRQIIDAASLLPIMGRKKIYLIDEAHMLSKAAFNAFLKILEEPPASVLFILATTDVHKIIDTVKSRSFQLFFGAVHSHDLVKHLEFICKQEEIRYEFDGLERIIQETEGSVRDALNLLEQVRFSNLVVTNQAVLSVLGHCDDEAILDLFEAVITNNMEAILAIFEKQHVASSKAESIWYGVINLVHSMLAVYHENHSRHFLQHMDRVRILSRSCSLSDMSLILQTFYDHELLFQKTRSSQRLLEMILIRLSQMDFNAKPIAPQKKNSLKRVVPTESQRASSSSANLVEKENVRTANSVWQKCISAIEQLDDPLLVSVFKQANCKELNKEKGIIALVFSQKFSFFEEVLEKAEASWKPLLEKVVGATMQCSITFDESDAVALKSNVQSAPVKIKRSEVLQKQEPKRFEGNGYVRKSYPHKKAALQESRVDVSDKNRWHKANMLLTVFPGIITEIKGGS